MMLGIFFICDHFHVGRRKDLTKAVTLLKHGQRWSYSTTEVEPLLTTNDMKQPRYVS